MTKCISCEHGYLEAVADVPVRVWAGSDFVEGTLPGYRCALCGAKVVDGGVLSDFEARAYRSLYERGVRTPVWMVERWETDALDAPEEPWRRLFE